MAMISDQLAEDLADREDAGFEMIMDISTDTRNLLARLAAESGGDEFEVIGKAVALYQVALDARREGKRIGIFGEDDELEREIIASLKPEPALCFNFGPETRMSDSEKPIRKGSSRKPPAMLAPVSIRGEFREKETRLEHESRVAGESADAELDRTLRKQKADLEAWRERLILRSGLIILCVVGTYCLVLNMLPGGSADQRAWATATLTGIVSGLVGYVVGTARK